jgi:biopolymer transport protein ExbD
MAGLLRKRKRQEAEIPTSSMADIAFLLLIFFLVTTTIDVDTGIGMTLPPPLEDDQTPPEVRERNMLRILVNEAGQVLIDDQPSAINRIREEVVRHVTNFGQLPQYSESPDQAVVSIKTDRMTPYSLYIDTLDEVWMAYYEIWDNEARQMGFPNYRAYRDQLGGAENEIRQRFRAGISIAEPDAG